MWRFWLKVERGASQTDISRISFSFNQLDLYVRVGWKRGQANTLVSGSLSKISRVIAGHVNLNGINISHPH